MDPLGLLNLHAFIKMLNKIYLYKDVSIWIPSPLNLSTASRFP